MKKIIQSIVIVLIATQGVLGQLLPHFKLLNIDSAYLSEEPGLRSNVINCIALQGDQTTWIGTGQGISVMHDSTSIFTLDTLQIQDGEPRFLYDSIASMAVQSDILALASSSREDGVPLGTGIYITEKGLSDQIEWKRFDQPVDVLGDSLAEIGIGYFRARPITKALTNVTYDMDISGDYLWIVSWAGGLRRLSLSKMDKWERIPLPLDSLEELNTCDENLYELVDGNLVLKDYYLDSSDPEQGGNHNHKGFSVLAYGDTVWVGTANGINRGILGENGCVNWRHFSHPNDNLSGNWVLSIAKQENEGKRIIWAVTVNAILPSEQRSVSFTRDDGETWEIVEELAGERYHDISIQGSTILIASDSGLWKSNDGTNWELIPPAVEATPVSSDEILNNTVYAVAADSREYFSKPLIWIGTPDGLARSYNFMGDNWQIYRAEYDKGAIYAYPNPFSPYSHNQLNNDGWVRFNTGDYSVRQVDLNIYNFALETVYSERFNWQTNPGAVKWNGRDNKGNLVANGVYFVNLQFSASSNSTKENYWVKLVVVK
ncbi:MAG: hypothetical protein GWP19_02915 [Planctomycetia bacterium]|nr:hypothetical protein [Planctomycetia bacterium]